MAPSECHKDGAFRWLAYPLAEADLPVFRDFSRLYEQCFPDDNEREDATQLLDRLREPLPADLPDFRILVLLEDATVAGGVVLEYYRQSCCILITYICVDGARRGRGVARRLLAHVRDWCSSASHSRWRVKAVLAETNIPWHTQVDSFPPTTRLDVFRRLGARWIDIPYVQPALDLEKNRVTNLFLIAFPFVAALSETEISVPVLRAFLREFYHVLQVHDGDADPDLQRMLLAIGTAAVLPLKDLPSHEPCAPGGAAP